MEISRSCFKQFKNSLLISLIYGIGCIVSYCERESSYINTCPAIPLQVLFPIISLFVRANETEANAKEVSW